ETCPSLIQSAAGIVEAGLGGSQGSRLSPRLGGGINPITLVELADRTRQLFIFLELASVLFQLVECVGNVAEEIGGERRQGFRQRGRQAGLVGFFRELRLA